MASIKVLKEPGFIYDLNFLFYAKFNTQLCVDSLPDAAKRESYKKHLNDILSRFGDIPDELYVFYHANTNGRCFMTTAYISACKDRFATDFDFKYFKSLFSDVDSLTRKLISFYLHDLSDEELEECHSSATTFFSYIKASGYSDEEKSKLYEFFIDPEPYIQTLMSELTEKEIRLSAYYKDNYQLIIDVHNDTTFDSLCENVKDVKDLSFLRSEDQLLYVSFCLLNKHCMYMFFIPDGAMYMLGYDYGSIISALKKHRLSHPLDEMCVALGDRSRMQILRMLAEHKELSRKDFERTLDLSGTTAYHHLTLLTGVGAVKVRNKGKTIYYSLNKEFCNTLTEQLKVLFK